MDHNDAQPPGTIRVFLADDNLIVREGVRALIDRHADLQVPVRPILGPGLLSLVLTGRIHPFPPGGLHRTYT